MGSDNEFSRFRPHPWHGIKAGPNPPEVVTAYIEVTPTDEVKYELEKETGFLRVDRPQRTSAMPPTLYGFIPRTYCAERVAKLAHPHADVGDGDPLDICIVSERPIMRSDIMLTAHVVGGLQMIDDGEADDKIIAVLEGDLFWGGCQDVTELPDKLVERMSHYFSTYKLVPGTESPARIVRTYDKAHAMDVVRAACDDYQTHFGSTEV